MNISIYPEMLLQLERSSKQFLGDDQALNDELKEDFETIIDEIDINTWKENIDGVVKDAAQLLLELSQAIEHKDRQKCIESIAMLRIPISNIESAFSNAKDSMEKLVVSIRDKEET